MRSRLFVFPLALALALGACAKKKPSAGGDARPSAAVASDAGTVVDRLAEQRAEARAVRTALEGAKPGAIPAEALAKLVKSLGDKPTAPEARGDLLHATAAVEAWLLKSYLASEEPLSLPVKLAGLTELKRPADLVRAGAALWTQAEGLAPPDHPGAIAVRSGRERLEPLTKANTDRAAWMALKGSGDPGMRALAAAFALRAVTQWAREIEAVPEAQRALARTEALIELGCPACGPDRTPGAALAIPRSEGGLACEGEPDPVATMGGCSLPPHLRAVPPALSGRLGPSTLAAIWGLHELVALAYVEGVPPAYAPLQKRARALVADLSVEAPLALRQGIPLDTATGGGLYSMAPSSALNLAAVPASSLVVGPAGITLDLAARAVVRDGKVAWEGGSSAPILSAAESAARKKARAEAMARARDRLKRLLPLRDGAPLAPVLIVDLRARPALLSALAEIYEAVDLPAPSVLRVPTSAMGGVPFWFSDATPRPETFPEEVATIRRGRESVKIILAGAALEAALARAAERQSDTQPPEGIQVKLKGKRARRRFTLTVGDASDGLDATALTMALRWLDDAYGPIPAYRLDARGVPPEQWQPILYALLDGETEAARMAWVKPELTSDEPGAPWSVRPVALQLRIRARGEKPKAVAPPKPKPVPMGFCEKKDIAKVMRGRMGAFRFCYERRLQYNPNLQGKLGLRFTISESGKVESVRVVKKTIADKEVEACVIKNIKKLHFAKPQGGKCVVQWPFVFHRN